MDDPIEVEFPSSTPRAVSTNASVKWYAFDAPAGYQIDWAVTHTGRDDILKVSIHAEVDPTATPAPERVEYLSFEVGALDAENGSFYSKVLARCYDDWPGSIPLAQGKVHWNMWRLDSSWTEVVKLLPGGGTSVAAFKRELK